MEEMKRLNQTRQSLRDVKRTAKRGKGPRELHPSSYLCDCGYQGDHSENTIRELKEKSFRHTQVLISEDGQHEIVFKDGEVVSMYCPVTREETPVRGMVIQGTKRSISKRTDPESSLREEKTEAARRPVNKG
jgi:hypothetical protein